MRRAVHALIDDALKVPPSSLLNASQRLPALTLPFLAPALYRSHSTVRSLSKGHHRRETSRLLSGTKKANNQLRRSAQDHLSSVDKKYAIARQKNKEREEKEAALRKHETPSDEGGFDINRTPEAYYVQFLKDPLRLANEVLKRLRNDDTESALRLIRLSEKDMGGQQNGKPGSNIVSWNHVCDYYMNKKQSREAIKIYNEVKKRGHTPDAHTYAIMIRGYTENITQPGALQNALNIYNSMFAANSAIRPSIMHTNAILNACARAQDVDSMWTVAGHLPDGGPGAPDKWTFTTILNALSASIPKTALDLAREGGEEMVPNKVIDKPVDEGRQLWEDVTSRWKTADLKLDQMLVASMGRLLLLGRREKDWLDVFALIEQTMQISRPSWLRFRQAKDKPELAEAQIGDELTSTEDASAELELMSAGKAEQAAISEFAPVIVQSPRGEKGVMQEHQSPYATPGPNTLSMLMQAATQLRSVPAAKFYWEELTNPKGAWRVKPDANNINLYLRMLRHSHSSKDVVELLRNTSLQQDNPGFDEALQKRGTYMLAMSACVRDKNNPNVFDHASSIVDLMQQHLIGPGQGPDSKVLTMYLVLAQTTTPGMNFEATRCLPFDPDKRRNNTLRALSRLGPSVLNVKDIMRNLALEERNGLPAHKQKDVDAMMRGRKKDTIKELVHTRRQKIEDLSEFLLKLVSTYDRCLNFKDKLPPEWVEDAKLQIKKLDNFVSKTIQGMKGELRSNLQRQEGEIRNPVHGAEQDGVNTVDAVDEQGMEKPRIVREKLTKRERERRKIRSQLPPRRDVGRVSKEGAQNTHFGALQRRTPIGQAPDDGAGRLPAARTLPAFG